MDESAFLWPAPVVHLQGFGEPALGITGRVRSDDYPETWVPVRAGPLTVVLELPIEDLAAGAIRHLELRLDGETVVSAKQPSNNPPDVPDSATVGRTFAYHLPCPAVGKHVLQARYLAEGFWSDWSQPLRFEVHGPDRPVIEGIGPNDCHPSPVRRGEVMQTAADTIKLKLANVLPEDKVVAYLDGQPIKCGTVKGCCVEVPLKGHLTPGIHRLAVRTMPAADCAVSSELSEEVRLHYYAPEHYILWLADPRQGGEPECPCSEGESPSPCHCTENGEDAGSSIVKNRADLPQPGTTGAGLPIDGDLLPWGIEGAGTEFVNVALLTAPTGETTATQPEDAEEAGSEPPVSEPTAVPPPLPALQLDAEQPAPKEQPSDTQDAPQGAAPSTASTTSNPTALDYATAARSLQDRARISLEAMRDLAAEARVDVRAAQQAAENAAKHEATVWQVFGSNARALTNTNCRKIAYHAQEARRCYRIADERLNVINACLAAARTATDRATSAANNAHDSARRAALSRAHATILEETDRAKDYRRQAELARDEVLENEQRAGQHFQRLQAAVSAAHQHESAADAARPPAMQNAIDAANAADDGPAPAAAGPEEDPSAASPPLKKHRSFVFASVAHFPLREFGQRGDVINREGLIIYEDMRFIFYRDGSYEVRFRSTPPEMPVTLRLQFHIQPKKNCPWYTVTLAPIHLRYQESKQTMRLCSSEAACDSLSHCDKEAQCCSPTRACVCRGHSEILRLCFQQMDSEAQIRRTGTARFGFGVDVP